MSADLFVTCFVACLFALGTVVVATWQITRLFAGRWFTKNLPKIIHQATATMHGGDPAAQAMLDELVRNAKLTPPGITPHLSAIRCRCGREQSVPLDLDLQSFLEDIGWKYSAEPLYGWACPICVPLAKANKAE